MNDEDDMLADESRRRGEDEAEGTTPADDFVDLQERLRAAEGERDEYLDLARRARADYVNLQRRMEAQSEAVREAARNEFARDVLAVLDDLELALKHAREGQDYDGLVGGIELVRSKFITTLRRYGIEPVEAEGTPFDHNIHDAVAQHPTIDAAPGTVFAVIQKGYTTGGKLLRPARVVVASEPPREDPENT